MTREEVIVVIKAYRDKLTHSVSNQLDGDIEAYNMAIEALEQKPTDAISRQAVLELIADYDLSMGQVVKGIHALPSVKPQEPKTIHSSTYGGVSWGGTYKPQEPKEGHWIEKDGYDGDTYYDCSECGESWTTIEGTPWNNGMKYCPNCGAKMRGW